MMKKFTALALALAMAFTFVACSGGDEEVTTTEPTTTTTTTEAPAVVNPFTGEENYNEAAVGQRPVAVVVENHPDARPQWNITTPDIIVEGVVEGGISRMLWLYADYTSLPDQIGPVRSIRPSYAQFSTFFDAVLIHWGGSNSKSTTNGGSYTGGYETISALGIDHIDGMNGGSLFGRDKSRGVSSEHTGILKGANLVSTIQSMGIDMDIDTNHETVFDFYEESTDVGTTVANSVGVKFTSASDTRKFTYDSTEHKYVTTDWKTTVSFKNIIVLMASTTNYPTSGSGTYVNYSLSSGSGYLISNGTQVGINWSTASGSLVITDANGDEVKLNVGDSYIGLASSNNGGSVTCG